MTPRPVCVGPGTPVREVARIMAERRFRHVPIVDDEERLVGLLSQRDLVASSPEDDTPVEKRMHTQIDTIGEDCCAAEAARHMLRMKRSCLPVVDDERRVVGMLTEADYLRLATRGAPLCSCVGVTVAES